jgi:hypothetical protein
MKVFSDDEWKARSAARLARNLSRLNEQERLLRGRGYLHAMAMLHLASARRMISRGGGRAGVEFWRRFYYTALQDAAVNR